MGKTATFDAVVIGAGWAGLGASQALAQRGIDHVVLERNRIGESWHSQRWDSFHLNSPNDHSLLPGETYTGSDPTGAMSNEDFIAHLEDYAQRHALPVETGQTVTRLTGTDGDYRVTTPCGSYHARAVVVASGNQNLPLCPPVTAALPADLHQIHAGDYRNPGALSPGAVLVVGCAQSGGQIADDLVRGGRNVFLSTGRVGRFPRLYRGDHIFNWLERIGLLDVPRASILRNGQPPGRPLVGARTSISLQSLSAAGVVLLGRLTGVENGRLTFADDLAETMRLADEGAAALLRQIDDFILAGSIDASPAEADPVDSAVANLPKPPIRTLDPGAVRLSTVIWCTGFTGDFGWIDIPGVLSPNGQPLLDGTISACAALHFPGLAFSISRRSGTIRAVAIESRQIGNRIAAFLKGRAAPDDVVPPGAG